MDEITRQVGANSDDVWRRLDGNAWYMDRTFVMAGLEGDPDYHQVGSGMRFTNITIPQGSTINQAYLTLRAQDSFALTVVNTRISAEDVNDAPTFADDKVAFDARWAARTTARVDWDNIPGWTLNEDYNSPEIKTVIKEIVDRVGWNSGQNIVIFWEDFEDRSTRPYSSAYRRGYSYEGSAEFAPKLVIKYTPPVVGWTGKISGVTNPAKIMGVDVANIKSVKGVE